MADLLTQELKILLRTIADLTGVNQVRTGVAETTAEFEAASAASSEFSAILGGLIGGTFALGITALTGALLQIPSLIAQSREEWQRADEEITKTSGQLNDQISLWDDLARGATKFSDVVSLAGKGIAELTKLSNDLEKAQSKQLSFWQTLEDAFAKGGGNDELGGPVDDDRGTNAAARADKIQQKQALLNKGVDELTAKEKEAEESADKLTDALTNQAPSVALSSYNKQLEEARQKLAAINPNSLAGQVAWEAQSKEVVRLVGDVKQLRDIQGKADTESADFSIKQRQAAIEEARARGENVDAAQHQLSVEQKIGELTKTKAEALRDGTVTQAQINSLAEREVTNAERLKAAHAGTHSEASGLRLEHQQIEALLAQENQQISKIKSDLQAIDSNPFLTINEKDAANAQLIPQAIEKLNQQITQNKAVIANSALDPRLWTQAQGNIQKATTEIGQWQIKLQLANNPMKQLQASLTSWVNSFGRTANQIGSAITNTIGTAVSGVSNAITGAIFKTQSWGQAFAQTAQQIVGNLVNIVLQWAEQQLAMLALHAIFGQTAAATTASVAAESAAAWAPAATAASIATEGEADLAGTTALAAAMAAGQGIVTGFSSAGGGGFAAGGFTGGQEGRFAGFVHGEEFVFSAPAVRRAGVGNLENLHVNLTRPSYEAGGFVGRSRDTVTGRSGQGGGDSHEWIVVRDENEAAERMFASRAARKHIRAPRARSKNHGPPMSYSRTFLEMPSSARLVPRVQFGPVRVAVWFLDDFANTLHSPLGHFGAAFLRAMLFPEARDVNGKPAASFRR